MSSTGGKECKEGKGGTGGNVTCHVYTHIQNGEAEGFRFTPLNVKGKSKINFTFTVFIAIIFIAAIGCAFKYFN
jgi:hypothetical protein